MENSKEEFIKAIKAKSQVMESKEDFIKTIKSLSAERQSKEDFIKTIKSLSQEKKSKEEPTETLRSSSEVRKSREKFDVHLSHTQIDRPQISLEPDRRPLEPQIVATKPESVLTRVGNYIKRIGESSEEAIAKAQITMDLSDKFRVPPSEIEDNFDSYTRAALTDIPQDPLLSEMMTPFMVGGLAAGVVAAPIATIGGLAAFVGIEKAFPTHKFIPTDASDTVRTTIEMADFVAKAAVASGIVGVASGFYKVLTNKNFLKTKPTLENIVKEIGEKEIATVKESAKQKRLSKKLKPKEEPVNPDTFVEEHITKAKPKKTVEPVEKLEIDPEMDKPEFLMDARKWGVDYSREPVESNIPTVSRYQMRDYIEKNFGIPIRRPLTEKHKGEGWYSSKQDLIVTKNFGEVEVMMHEVAHGVDKRLRTELGKNWKEDLAVHPLDKIKINKELRRLDYDKTKQRPSEGFAEYIRHKTTTKEEKSLAPTFDKYFNEFIDAKYPSLNVKFNRVLDYHTTFRSMGSEARILSHVDFDDKMIIKDNKISKAYNSTYRQLVDSLNPIKRVETALLGNVENIPTSKSAFKLGTLLKKKANGYAETFVMKKAIDEAGNVVGPGLYEILAPIPKKDMKPFIAFLLSLRSKVYEMRGKEHGFDSGDIQYIYHKYKNNKIWKDTAVALTEWANHGIDLIIKAGGLTEKEAHLMRKLNPIYAKIKRIFVDEQASFPLSSSILAKSKGIKRIKGGSHPIMNPLEAMIVEMRDIIQTSHKLRVTKAFTDLAKIEGSGRYIRKIPPKITATKVSLKQLEGSLRDLGITVDTSIDKLLTVYSVGEYYGKANVISVVKGGKRVLYEIDKEIFEAFNTLNNVQLDIIASMFLKMTSFFARGVRLGATQLRASFNLFKNPIRDAQTYRMYSQSRNATIFDPITGLYKDLTGKEGSLAWRFNAIGGKISTQMGYDRATTMNIYDDMLIKNMPYGKILKVIKHPINTLRDMLSVSESGPRVAELQRVYKGTRIKHPDWSEEDCFHEAFLAAQDVTVNFSRGGQLGQCINKVTAFFTSNVQGLDKLAREVKTNPKRLLIRGFSILTPIAMYQWHMNRNEQWYKNLPLKYKYNNLFFKIGNEIIRLPIPFELGTIFMGLPMAIMDSMSEAELKPLEAWFSNLKNSIPNPTPSIAAPMIDVMRNKDYLGRPIESEGMKYQSPDKRTRIYTMEISKALSKGFVALGVELSPVQIDHLISSYTGGMVQQFKFNAERGLKGIPVISDILVQMPEKPQRQLLDFFERYGELKQNKKDNTINVIDSKKLQNMDYFYNHIYTKLSKRIKDFSEKRDYDNINKTYELLGTFLEKYEKTYK